FLCDWRGAEVLNDSISFRTVLAYARKEGVSVTTDEIREELNKQLGEVLQGEPKGGDIEARIRREGFPRSRLWLRVHSQLLVDKMLLRAFDPSQFVKVSTLVVRTASDDAEAVAAAASKAKDLFDRLGKGLRWEDALKEVTEDSRVLSTGGSIGWKLLSAFSTSTGAELRSMRPGGITKPSLTANGFQIFRLDALGSEAKGAELDQLRALYLLSERPAFLRKIQEAIPVEVAK
ncbi:MAG: peptidylprolyl isomerase, partial [Fimbriimonadales bacterium]